jgi:CRISPR/Cas system-associated exonuclease Cas4 (RecB family)
MQTTRRLPTTLLGRCIHLRNQIINKNNRFYSKTLPKVSDVSLSFSRLNTYLSCPLSYKYKYIDDIKAEPGVPQLFGSALHNAIDVFGKQVINKSIEARSKEEPLTVTRDELRDEILQLMFNEFEKVILQGKQEIDEFIQTLNPEDEMDEYRKNTFKFNSGKQMHKGKQILTSFIDREIENGAFAVILSQTDKLRQYQYPVLSEEDFEYVTDIVNERGERVKVRGVWDRVDAAFKYGRRSDLIMEYKTKVTHYSHDRYYLQIVLYMHAHQKIFQKLPDEARLVSITNGYSAEYSLEELQNSIDQMDQIIVDVSNSIINKEFDAKPSEFKCKGCTFRYICPSRHNEDNEEEQDD